MRSKLMTGLLVVGAMAVSAPFVDTSAKTNKDVPMSVEDLSKLTESYGNILFILQNYYVDTLDIKDLVKSGYQAMLGKIDPYTEFYTQDNLDDLRSVMSGDYGGIGCAISLRDSVVVMSAPYYDSPAARAGIHHGDILLMLNGEEIKGKDIKISDVSSRLRGEPGTDVSVKVHRPWLPENTDSIFDITITREKIKIDPLPYFTILDGGIAYFDVSTFNQNTASEIRREFSRMKAEKGDSLRGVILDLRSNGGGITAGATDLLSIFMPRGSHVYTARYRNDESQVTKTKKSPVDTEIPLAVMINDETASSSEIVAGAIQDLDRGVITGSRSYGKGLIQTSASVGPSSVLKYTIGKYYLPSGRLIQALDYTARDGRARLTTVTDTTNTVFKTRAGRPVTDGRGIRPDVELKADTVSDFVYNIFLSGAFDDYANRYRNNHDFTPDRSVVFVTDSVLSDFKSFLDPDKIKYDRRSENGISYLRTAAKYEKIDNDSVMQTLDLLERLMRHDLDRDFEAFESEIRLGLESQIAQRYFSDHEQSARILATDKMVEETRQLLLDPKRYREILSPQKR